MWQRLTWPATLALHLLPGAGAFALALLVAPLARRLGIPASAALTVAFALLLTPVELAILLRAARRGTGRWSLRGIGSVVAFRRPLRWWWLLVPPLFALALAFAVVWTPAGDALGARLDPVLPDWMLPGFDDAAGVSRHVVVAALLVSLLVDGLVNPTVEELYFRGYLLPRLPVTGWPAVLLSAGLFAIQHYWQPYNWPLIFVLQLILTALVLRLRCLRLGIAMHVLSNCFGIALSLFTLLR